jgi:4-oxalocrotonate tautomerase
VPTITVEGPPVDLDKKRRLARELADGASAIYGIPHITVLIKENAPENVGLSGELLADRRARESGAPTVEQ